MNGSNPNTGFYILTTDGAIEARRGQAAREASIGAVLRTPKGKLLGTISKRIGSVKDHQVAEYQALVQGLRLARRRGIQRLRVFVDSALVANQLHGVAKVRAEHLKRLHKEAKRLRAIRR